jgi:biopolymer transport protein ExbD
MAGSISSNYGDDEDGAMSGINVTPLVDVTLVLLIVFMITVPVIVGSARVKIDVPETTSVEPEPEQMPIVFALKREGDKNVLYLNDSPIDEAGVIKMFGDKKLSKEQAVSLSADRVIPYGEVIRYVDILEKAGLKKLSLDTRHVEAR